MHTIYAHSLFLSVATSAKLARQAQSREKILGKMVAAGLTEKVSKDRVSFFPHIHKYIYLYILIHSCFPTTFYFLTLFFFFIRSYHFHSYPQILLALLFKSLTFYFPDCGKVCFCTCLHCVCDSNFLFKNPLLEIFISVYHLLKLPISSLSNPIICLLSSDSTACADGAKGQLPIPWNIEPHIQGSIGWSMIFLRCVFINI